MASSEATERRRANRRAKTAAKEWESMTRAERDRETAVRMTKRFFPGQTIDLLWLDMRYWQLRRCGYDVGCQELRIVGKKPDGSLILCEPMETVHWQWWSRVHYESRDHMVRISKFRLLRQAESRNIQLHLITGGGLRES